MAVRMADIARKADVSVQAVSSVLHRTRSTSGVGKETRKRVMKLAEELGYKPHAAARALATGKTGCIGLVGYDWGDPHMQKALMAVGRITSKHKYNVMTTATTSHGEWYEMLLERKVDLIITAGIPQEDNKGFPEDIRRRIIAVGPVIVGKREPYWGWSVMWDDIVGGAKVADYLIELGHRNLAVLSHIFDSTRTIGFVRRAREKGIDPYVVLCDPPSEYEDTSRLSGLPAEKILRAPIADIADRTEAGIIQFAELMKAASGTTAVFCRNDRIAIGAISEAAQMGIDVPGDISIVGYTDSYEILRTHPALTTVRTPIVEAMELTMEKYFAGEFDGDEMPDGLILDTKLIERDTARAIV